MRKILCKILTLGRHWWIYGGSMKNPRAHIECRICEKIPGNQWEIYVKKFKGKPGGRYFGGEDEKKYYKELARFIREVLIPEGEERRAFTNRIIKGKK